MTLRGYLHVKADAVDISIKKKNIRNARLSPPPAVIAPQQVGQVAHRVFIFVGRCPRGEATASALLIKTVIAKSSPFLLGEESLQR